MRLRPPTGRVIAVYREHQALLSTVNELASYDSVVAENQKAIVDGVSGRAKAALEQAIAQNAVGPLRTRETACALTWMLERTCHQMVRHSPPEADDAIADALTEIVWRIWYLEPASR